MSIKRIAAALGCMLVTSIAAADQPPLNLGLTSFLDGGVPQSESGWIFLNYLQNYSANRLNDKSGNRLPFADQKVDLTANIAQIVYISQREFAGANLGWTVLVPSLIDSDVSIGPVSTPGGTTRLSGKTGLGDIFIGPILQFKPVMGPNGPVFVQRFEADFILPTGRYDANTGVNPGSNFWSFNPYWAGTYWFTPKWTGSARLHYVYNGKNKDAPGGTFQAGQAVHANFATEYAVTPSLRIGLNGYWLNQFTDTKINGVKQNGQRDRVWAIGPGLLYNITKSDALFFNAYFEQGAKNVGQGDRYVLRYVHSF